jgi:hypothetical protein
MTMDVALPPSQDPTSKDMERFGTVGFSSWIRRPSRLVLFPFGHSKRRDDAKAVHDVYHKRGFLLQVFCQGTSTTAYCPKSLPQKGYHVVAGIPPRGVSGSCCVRPLPYTGKMRTARTKILVAQWVGDFRRFPRVFDLEILRGKGALLPSAAR